MKKIIFILTIMLFNDHLFSSELQEYVVGFGPGAQSFYVFEEDGYQKGSYIYDRRQEVDAMSSMTITEPFVVYYDYTCIGDYTCKAFATVALINRYKDDKKINLGYCSSSDSDYSDLEEELKKTEKKAERLRKKLQLKEARESGKRRDREV